MQLSLHRLPPRMVERVDAQVSAKQKTERLIDARQAMNALRMILIPCSSWRHTHCRSPQSAMSDLLLDELPTRWHGYEIIPDFRPMVWLVNTMCAARLEMIPSVLRSALSGVLQNPHCFLNDPQKIIDAYGYMIEFYKAGEKQPKAPQLKAVPRPLPVLPSTTSVMPVTSWRRSSRPTAST